MLKNVKLSNENVRLHLATPEICFDPKRDIGHQQRQLATELLTGPVVSYQTRFCLEGLTKALLIIKKRKTLFIFAKTNRASI